MGEKQLIFCHSSIFGIIVEAEKTILKRVCASERVSRQTSIDVRLINCGFSVCRIYFAKEKTKQKKTIRKSGMWKFVKPEKFFLNRSNKSSPSCPLTNLSKKENTDRGEIVLKIRYYWLPRKSKVLKETGNRFYEITPKMP